MGDLTRFSWWTIRAGGRIPRTDSVNLVVVQRARGIRFGYSGKLPGYSELTELAFPRPLTPFAFLKKMSESQGSGLRLSLERQYKDDIGRPIRTVSDITSDGHYIFEPCASTTLGVAVVWELTTCSGQR